MSRGSEYVWSAEQGGERRDESLVPTADGGFVVEEATSGPVTMQTFDQERHVHGITIPPGAVDGFVEALSGAGGIAASDVVASFFSDGDACLSDLMDLLDLCGVRYSYLSSADGKVIAFRPGGSA